MNNNLYFLENVNKLNCKINARYNVKLCIYEIEIIFKLSSDINNKIKFIIMLSLMEKLLNNQLVFLLDKHTLSNKKTIKIGYISSIRKDKLFNFVKLCYLYSTPKTHKGQIIFDFIKSNKTQYSYKKILYNFVFNVDKNINFYYDYLNNFDYNITFFFKTLVNSIVFDKLILNFYKFDFIEFDNILINNLINNTFINIISNVEKDDLFFINIENDFNYLNNGKVIYCARNLYKRIIDFDNFNTITLDKNLILEDIDYLLLNYIFLNDAIDSYYMYKNL